MHLYLDFVVSLVIGAYIFGLMISASALSGDCEDLRVFVIRLQSS